MAPTSIAHRFSCLFNSLQIRRNRRRVVPLQGLSAGYIAIPKVASTSLRSLICRRHAQLYSPEHLSLEIKPLVRAVEKEIRISCSVDQLQALRRELFLFTFVRNPITRLYSCYLDKVVKPGKEGEETDLRRHGVTTDMSFEAFASLVCDTPDHWSDRHFRSQHPYIYEGDELLVDFVGKFEQLAQDWDTIARKIHLEERPQARRSSGAGNTLEQIPLTRATANRLVARYSRDIELLGYTDTINRWLKTLGD